MIGLNLLLKIVAEKESIVFARLKRSWFEDIEKNVFDYINNFFNRYKRLPQLSTIIEEFGIDRNPSEPIEYYLDKFSERLARNIIEGNLDRMNSLMEEGKYTNVVELFEKISAEIREIKVLLRRDIKNIKEIIELSLTQLIERRVIETGVPTGWQTLDYITGGLQNGNIFLVLARVKMGKTLVLLRMANAGYNAGKKVLFISMEMTAPEIGLRIAGLRLGLNLQLLQRSPISTTAERLLREELNRLSDNFQYVEGQFKTNIKEIISIIETHEPDVVYIDGGYLIRPASSVWKSKWEMMGDVIENLKTCATRFNIPIAISFQFNREVKRTTQTISDRAFEKIQLSDAIAQVASTGIAILDNDKIPNTRKIEVIGGRGGEQGEFIINWDWERMNFEEYDSGL